MNENEQVPCLSWSEKTDKIFPAYIKAQSGMSKLVKESTNPFFKSKYADLAAVTEACNPALHENGIAHFSTNRKDGDGINVSIYLIHESGQWMRSDCHIPSVKSDPQAYGSAYTYGRRYGITAATGLAATDSDDDGNAATSASNKASPPPQKPISEVQKENIIQLIEKADFSQDQIIKSFLWASSARTENLDELKQAEAAKLISFITNKLK